MAQNLTPRGGLSLDFIPSAPVVGPHHKKSSSLVGFDPLLDDSLKKEVQSASNGSKTPPLLDDKQEPHGSPLVKTSHKSPKELAKDLRTLASEIEKNSSSPSTPSRRGKLVLGISSNVGKLHLPWNKKKTSGTDEADPASSPGASSPPPPVASKGAPPSAEYDKDALVNPDLVALAAKLTPIPSGGAGNQADTLSSPMMQELWYSTNAMNDLSMPSLAKPRPTSFLTGKEVVHTSEQDATDWQVAIPPKKDFEVASKVCQFLATYQSDECCLDLTDLIGFSRLDLSQFARGDASSLGISSVHRPAVESLLECGDDITQVLGHYVAGEVHDDPAARREFLILERQQQILCVFRGTKAEQQGKFPKLVETGCMKENDGVEVFNLILSAFSELEHCTFALLDRATEENPFCDVAFTGHGFGAGIATLAAFRYASGRPEIRVAALVTGSPKVGIETWKLAAHSLPNLKIHRVELGSAPPHTSAHHGGLHVGHTIRISPKSAITSPPNSPKAGTGESAFGSNQHHPVVAYRFGDRNETASVRALFKRDRVLADYVNALESLDDAVWVHDYYQQDGAGVRGKDDEARYMV